MDNIKASKLVCHTRIFNCKIKVFCLHNITLFLTRLSAIPSHSVVMTEVHSVYVVVEKLLCRAAQGSTVRSDWESRQSSGDYRIPSAQTSHPPGNRENGGNQRVRGRSPSQCSLGHLDYLLPTQCSTITDIIRSTWNKGGKIVHCSQSPLHVPFIHHRYSPMRGCQLYRWTVLWARTHFLIKEINTTSTLQIVN